MAVRRSPRSRPRLLPFLAVACAVLVVATSFPSVPDGTVAVPDVASRGTLGGSIDPAPRADLDIAAHDGGAP